MLNKSANELSIEEIEAYLYADEAETQSAEKTEETSGDTHSAQEKKEKSIENTRAFAHRLKDATNKARNEERENIAKSMGYENYEEMRKDKEALLLREKGLDPEEVAPVVEELLQKRLSEDPRLKELEEFRQQRMEEWAKKELAEITSLTNGRVKSLNELPESVINLWKQKGSLKSAYLELEGEKIIKEMQSNIVKGSTGHLNSVSGAPPSGGPDSNKRPMTDKEKAVYRVFHSDISEEELSKRLVDK